MAESVSKPDGWFETVQLRDEDGLLEAAFVPGAGMLCCSLRHRGEELLAQNAGVAAYAESGKTMGIPLLYPWANRLSGFDYCSTGRTIAVPHDPARIALDEGGLPIHGVIGGQMAWDLTRTPGDDGHSLLAHLSWSELAPHLFEVFPFRHDILYEARLADGHLDIEITVHACGTDTLPVSFGFHPYLSLPETRRERWLIELPPMRHLALDARQIPIGAGQSLPARDFELDDEVFDDGFDKVETPARFSVAAARRRVALEFLEGYPCAQVFSPSGGAFVCFEPMTAPTNALRSRDALRLLAPGEHYRAAFSLSVDDLR